MSQNDFASFPIPYAYVWLTAGYANRGELFKKYVQAYVDKNHQGYELVRISGMNAICQKIER